MQISMAMERRRCSRQCSCLWAHTSLFMWVLSWNCPPSARPPARMPGLRLHPRSRSLWSFLVWAAGSRNSHPSLTVFFAYELKYSGTDLLSSQCSAFFPSLPPLEFSCVPWRHIASKSIYWRRARWPRLAYLHQRFPGDKQRKCKHGAVREGYFWVYPKITSWFCATDWQGKCFDGVFFSFVPSTWIY